MADLANGDAYGCTSAGDATILGGQDGKGAGPSPSGPRDLEYTTLSGSQSAEDPVTGNVEYLEDATTYAVGAGVARVQTRISTDADPRTWREPIP